MESKLNTLAIETYTKAFADRVANDFFARHDKINGEQILKLSPVQQINLFIIRNLFETWQQEASRLRSPYFNYSHPKVEEAQRLYMNTLSRHIAIDESHLKPLLHKAIQDTLVLLFLPRLYLKNTLEGSSGSAQEIEDILKYTKINQAYARQARNILNQQEVNDPQWLQNLLQALREQEVSGQLQPENPGPYLQQLAQVLPLHPSEIFQEDEWEKEEDDTDFFSSIAGSLNSEPEEEKKAAPARKETPPDRPQETPEPDIPQASEAAHRHAQFKRTEPQSSLPSGPEISISRPAPDNREVKVLNDAFGRERAPLNSRLSSTPEKPSVQSGLNARRKPGSMRSGINLNQRFMFTNELFGGDNNAFNQALDALDRFDNYEAARQHALQQYASRYDWDEESEAYLEFFDVLQARYS
ncbi:hypothetical protein [Nafulsella turpanensis]|uniref:hypothetical protein n=1 Tax=Nafulsella turpanensis TaxID=1265690 RepID=UPI000348DF7A|nr:hypothetical protein [Nafulsella turpanensis]